VEAALGVYRPRHPENTLFYRCLEDHWEEFQRGYEVLFERVYGPLRAAVTRAVEGFLKCGILPYGFARLKCDGCGRNRFLAYSCRTRQFCPSCAAKGPPKAPGTRPPIPQPAAAIPRPKTSAGNAAAALARLIQKVYEVAPPGLPRLRGPPGGHRFHQRPTGHPQNPGASWTLGTVGGPPPVPLVQGKIDIPPLIPPLFRASRFRSPVFTLPGIPGGLIVPAAPKNKIPISYQRG
jgi:hypothetical protein